MTPHPHQSHPEAALGREGKGGVMKCPICGCTRLFGPATIRFADTGEEHEYLSCARCHHLLLVMDGELVAKAGAW